MTDDRITRMRQIVQRQDELAEEAARLKAELHDLLELTGTPRKTRRNLLSKSAKQGLFAGLRKEAQNREHLST